MQTKNLNAIVNTQLNNKTNMTISRSKLKEAVEVEVEADVAIAIAIDVGVKRIK